jgi:hypothetical protein
LLLVNKSECVSFLKRKRETRREREEERRGGGRIFFSVRLFFFIFRFRSSLARFSRPLIFYNGYKRENKYQKEEIVVNNVSKKIGIFYKKIIKKVRKI